MSTPSRTLILGGQKSGKSALSEKMAQDWLSSSPLHPVLLIATASAHDEQMLQRIQRHQADRAQRVPRIQTVEEGTRLAEALLQYQHPQTLLIVDCLTLWLTNLLMPFDPQLQLSGEEINRRISALLDAIEVCSSPLIFVSNEIGLGVIPLGAQTRDFVDALGLLNQRVAARCSKVLLMVAGQVLTIK